MSLAIVTLGVFGPISTTAEDQVDTPDLDKEKGAVVSPHEPYVAWMVGTLGENDAEQRVRSATMLRQLGPYAASAMEALETHAGSEGDRRVRLRLEAALRVIRREMESMPNTTGQLDNPDEIARWHALPIGERKQAAEDLFAATAKDLDERIAALQAHEKSLERKTRAASKNVAAVNELKDTGYVRSILEGLRQFEQRRITHTVLGPDSPFVIHDGQYMSVAERELVIAEKAEEAAKLAALKTIHGSPKSAADNYIQSMLDSGSIRKAEFLAERADRITACIDIGQPADWPDRIRSVHYQIQYTSKAGFMLDREGYVTVFRAKNGLWFVSQDTQLNTNGIHF